MPSSPTPEEERALRHDLLILELQANPQVRARRGRLPWKSADRVTPPTERVPTDSEAPRA